MPAWEKDYSPGYDYTLNNYVWTKEHAMEVKLKHPEMKVMIYEVTNEPPRPKDFLIVFLPRHAAQNPYLSTTTGGIAAVNAGKFIRFERIDDALIAAQEMGFQPHEITVE